MLYLDLAHPSKATYLNFVKQLKSLRCPLTLWQSFFNELQRTHTKA